MINNDANDIHIHIKHIYVYLCIHVDPLTSQRVCMYVCVYADVSSQECPTHSLESRARKQRQKREDEERTRVAGQRGAGGGGGS